MPGVVDHPLHAGLHALLLGHLPLQPVVARVQLVLQRALVLLVDVGRLLQDVNLKPQDQ